MAQRLDLQAIFLDLIESTNVYFQQPPKTQMRYPCIIYRLDDIDTTFANNKPYNREKRYQVTIVDADPDSEIPDKVGALAKCTFDRKFEADQLNHFVYTLYF